MILDLLSNTIAFSTVRHWDAIADFISSTDLLTIEPGRYEIKGQDLYAIVADDEHKDVVSPLEAHRKYIDVQMAVRGSFDVLWRPLEQCTTMKKEYDAENDYLLMSDDAHTRIHLEPGVAAVFYPTDAHAPQPPEENVRKIVFKIKV